MNIKYWRKYLFVWGIIIGYGLLLPFNMSHAAVQTAPHVESSSTPEVHPSAPIPDSTQPKPRALIQAQAPTQTLGPNLIQNPSLESGSSLPTGWHSDRWSNNTGSFIYPVSGFSGKAAQITTTNYTSGDAKWYFDDVPVTAGHTYQFSDYYSSSVPTQIDVRYKMSDGSFVYKYLQSLNSNSGFQQNVTTFTVPQNVVSLTIFHLIQSVGTLTTDEYSLNDLSTPPPPPPPPSTNLILNSDFETVGSNGSPLHWTKNSWSNNTAVFSYPATGVNNSKAAKVTITSYTSGDAKWYFDPVAVSPGTYTYSDQYMSDKITDLTVQFQNQDGSFSYKDIAILPPSSTFTTATANFSVPNNVKSVTVFHLIQAVGSLTIDNASLSLAAAPSGIFTTGAVTLSFDDGWLSQYQNAVPKLKSAGLKGTFYIVSRQLADNGFPDFVSKSQVVDIFNAGNEIGAHTQTHPDLPTLTQAQQQTEIQGSRQDLLAMNVGPVSTFSYPYGDYNDTTIQIVKSAGFSAARATLDGYATSASDPYQLQRFSVESTVTPAQVKQWIDTAASSKQWLILTFHEVNTSGNKYSATPDTFNQIVDYLVQKKIPVVTIAQGIQSLH